jgi:hypothetical protein
VLKITLNKSAAAIGLVFSFTLAACDAGSLVEPAAYCYEDSHALLSGALRVDGQGRQRVYIAYYRGKQPFFLAGYEENQSGMAANNRKVRELCERIRKGEKINLPEPNL